MNADAASLLSLELLAVLFPVAWGIIVDDVDFTGSELRLFLSTLDGPTPCPVCNVVSTRTHSRYRRYPADTTLAEFPVTLCLRSRRMFCDNERCCRKVFTERLPCLVGWYARKTFRLLRRILAAAFELGGEAGRRLLAECDVSISADSLLRLIHDAPDVHRETPRVLGVDDWAKKKGRTYGTILIDLERGVVVDVLPERSAETLKQWLLDHPGVEIISRDRAGCYRNGATAGAPNAVQVADRWHLLKNLRDAIERVLQTAPECLRVPPRKDDADEETSVAEGHETTETKEEAPETKGGEEATPKTAATLRREKRFNEIKRLQAEGFSVRETARRMKLDRKTVRKYRRAETCPPYPKRRSSGSKLAPYVEYLRKRISDGCRHKTQLWRELRERGFNGSRGTVSRWILKNYDLGRKSTAKTNTKQTTEPPSEKTYSPKRTSWLFVDPDEGQRSKQDKDALEYILNSRESFAKSYDLGRRFIDMVRDREGGKLDKWLEDARKCGVVPMVNFAKSLEQDYEAVRNALILKWSNGQSEGQINRLKTIKRKVYGRAGFTLLRKLVLGFPY